MGTIDGASWSDVTIDGEPVQEITIDGSVVWSDVPKALFPENLIAWYRFEDGDARDYASNNEFPDITWGDSTDYSGTVYGTTYRSTGGITDFENGANSGAIEFNNTSGDRIETSNAGPLNDELTLSCWVNLDGPGDNSYNVFLCHGDGSHRKEIHWDADDDIRGPSTSEVGRKTVSGDIALNNWIHLATTFNNNTQRMKYYENGNLLLSEGYSGTFDNSSYPIHIGGSANIGADFINGLLDDARVYNRELSSFEIVEIYNNTKP